MEINMENQSTKDPNMEIKEIARKNFELWADSLKTKDPKEVAKLYSDDATFLPTVSGEFKRGKQGSEEYFFHFLQKNPEGKIIEDAIQAPTGESYLHSGMYNFEVNDVEGGRKIVEARFTFVWRKKDDGNWEIIHHHSSVRPESH
jgi:uncharacterized protein (TIGR02246 family)